MRTQSKRLLVALVCVAMMGLAPGCVVRTGVRADVGPAPDLVMVFDASASMDRPIAESAAMNAMRRGLQMGGLAGAALSSRTTLTAPALVEEIGTVVTRISTGGAVS